MSITQHLLIIWTEFGLLHAVMSSNEKSELLGNDEVRVQGKHSVVEPKLRCIHFVVLPVTILLFLPYGQDFYMAQQWIQHVVQKELEISSDTVSSTGCNSVNHSSPSYLAYKRVEQRTAQWTMYNSLAMSVPSFFGAALVPAYSDSFGRRYLFLISCSSCLIKLIIHGLCIYYSWSLIWVILGTGLDSLTGGVYTFLSALMSYAADITTPGRKRTFALTLVDGCMLLCVTLAGLISGLVIQYKGFVFLAFLDVLLSFTAWGIMVTALPETHDVRNRTEAGSIWQTYRRMLDVYISKTFKKRRVAYILLISAFFFEEMTNAHRSSIEILYQLGQPFCWSAGTIGVFSAARHATECVAGILFIAPLKTFLSDVSIAIWSTVSNAASFVLEACARTDTAMYLGRFVCFFLL